MGRRIWGENITRPRKGSIAGGVGQMADYDSDSSLEEHAEYEKTNVLLGYASKEPTDDQVSHLGGHPVRRPREHPLSQC